MWQFNIPSVRGKPDIIVFYAAIFAFHFTGQYLLQHAVAFITSEAAAFLIEIRKKLRHFFFYQINKPFGFYDAVNNSAPSYCSAKV